MTKGTNIGILVIALIVIGAVLAFMFVPFFQQSVFGGQFSKEIGSGDTTGIAKSNIEFGRTEDIIILNKRFQFWDNDVSIDNGRIILNLQSSVTSESGFAGIEVGSITTMIKTDYLRISPSDIESVSINFNVGTTRTENNQGGTVKIYLNEGNRDILLSSFGIGTSRSGVIKITNLDGSFFIGINEEQSNLINLPDGDYEILIVSHINGIIRDGSDNPISSKITISSITVKEKEVLVTVFRISNNVCESIVVNQNDVLSTDFTNLSDCEASLEGGEPEEPGEPTESSKTIAIIIAVIVGIIIIAVIVILVRRRK